MGFGLEARRVRDVSLPAACRVHALGSCIQLAQPIGFHATWSYLQEKVGMSWRHPDFLLPAIAMLERQRSKQLIVDAEYARLRREQKRAGRRVPRHEDVTPRHPRRWHGDEQVGALHALVAWRQRRPDQAVEHHPSGALVLAAVARVLATPTGQVGPAEELQRALDWARRRIRVVEWEADPSEYRVAWVIHYLLGQLHLVAQGATPLATPWNFHQA